MWDCNFTLGFKNLLRDKSNMNMKRIIVLGLGSVFLASSAAMVPSAMASEPDNVADVAKLMGEGVPAKPLKEALKAYNWAKAKGDVHNSKYLTLIDFAKPSNEKRMWVIDLNSNQVVFNGLVSQGKNSGLKYATKFSNKPGTKESSLGVYTTTNLFQGKHGTSLKVRGLESGINNNANSRTIEFHPAAYATPAFVKKYGRLGRSWGCFAVNPKYSTALFDKIKGGSVVFAYAPQENSDPNFT